jgi:TolA-binding protein
MRRMIFVFMLTGLFACQAGGNLILPEKETVETDVWKGLSADKIYEQSVKFVREEKPQHAMDGFKLLAEQYPGHKHSIDAVLSMGKIYTDQFREYDNGIKMFKKVAELYPDSSVTAQAYFMLGFINANYIANEDEARKNYETFLKKFPKHELAGSVQFELDNLGLNADDILKINLNDSSDVKIDSTGVK